MHRRGDGRRGDARPTLDDLIVTTGGQQAIDLISKTLLDPGDPVICEAPTYPGAIPTFCSYEADVIQVTTDEDGMRIDELEEVLGRPRRGGPPPEVHLLRPQLPEPRRRDPLGRAPRAPGRPRPRARGAGRRGQPLRPAPLRGRAAADPLLPRRRRLRPLPRHLLEDPLPRDPRRLGRRPAPGAGEDRARQTGGRPLHLDPDPVLRPRVLRRGPLARLHRRPDRDLPRPPRRDARRARPSTSPTRPSGRRPRAASSSGRRCPTTSTPPTSSPRRCARTSRSSPAGPPTSTGAAAPRCASTSPARARTRSARASAGSANVIGEQVALYETITREQPIAPDPEPETGRRRRPDAPPPRSDEPLKVAVLKGGRSLERGVSLRSAARVEDALEAPRPRGDCRSTSASDLVTPAARRAPRRRLRRPARPRRRGRHRPGAARDPRHPLHGARRRRLRPVHGQGGGEARAARAPASPTPGLGRLQRDRLPRARRRRHPRGDRGADGLPPRRQAGEPGLVARRQVRLGPRRGARAPWSPRSPTTTASCSSDTSTGRELAVGVLGSDPLPIVEAIPRDSDSSTSRPATRSGAPTTPAPPS